MSAEREAVLKTRQELFDADRALREAENAAHVARNNFERAKRRWDDLESRLGSIRVSAIIAGGN